MSTSVVIRAKNEENYIKACIEGVLNQDTEPAEVIVVDNLSTDKTANIASSLGARVISIEDYSPGKALNIGIQQTSSEFVALLSAHCVPKSRGWLRALTLPFKDAEVVGVYGRQLPLPYSHPQDKRDLYAVFGEEDRVQRSETFFHNANSAIRRIAWMALPFDEDTPHIEDRMWASSVQAKGKAIYYSSQAEVFHWNGLHASTDLVRANNSIKILNDIGVGTEEVPSFLQPDRVSVLPIIPARTVGKDIQELNRRLSNLCSQISNSKNILDPVLVVETGASLDIESRHSTLTLDEEVPVDRAIAKALAKIEPQGLIPDFVLYVNPEYTGREPDLFDKLVRTILLSGADTVFCGYRDFGHFWFEASPDRWHQVDSSLQPRENRQPTYRALYGLGTVVRTSIARNESLVGNGVTIVPIEEFNYSALSRGGVEFHSAGRGPSRDELSDG